MRQIRKIINESMEKNDVNGAVVKVNKEQQLADAVKQLADIKPAYDTANKTFTETKALVKTLCTDLNLDTYEGSGLKISISHVDKSYLEEGPVLEYLRKNNLTKFIKTKEYFDDAEIAMAIANGELKAEDLNIFIVEKEELRINIKNA